MIDEDNKPFDAMSKEEQLSVLNYMDLMLNLGIMNPTIQERLNTIPDEVRNKLAETITFELPKDFRFHNKEPQ